MLKKSFSLIVAGMILLSLSSPGFSQISFRTNGHKWTAMTLEQKENYVNGFKDGEGSVCTKQNLIGGKSRYYSGVFVACAGYEMILTREKMVALLDKVYETDKYKDLPPNDIISFLMNVLLSEHESLEGRERMEVFKKLEHLDILDLPYGKLYEELDERLELNQKMFEHG